MNFHYSLKIQNISLKIPKINRETLQNVVFCGNHLKSLCLVILFNPLMLVIFSREHFMSILLTWAFEIVPLSCQISPRLPSQRFTAFQPPKVMSQELSPWSQHFSLPLNQPQAEHFFSKTWSKLGLCKVSTFAQAWRLISRSSGLEDAQSTVKGLTLRLFSDSERSGYNFPLFPSSSSLSHLPSRCFFYGYVFTVPQKKKLPLDSLVFP